MDKMQELRNTMLKQNKALPLEFKEKMEYFKFIKGLFIKEQKKLISELRESGFCVRKECDKLNLMLDDSESGTEINHENFHLYYKFMIDAELEYLSCVLSSHVETRLNAIQEHFKDIDLSIKTKNKHIDLFTTAINGFDKSVHKVDVIYGGHLVKYFVFGVKDNFEPIGDYIAQIKISNTYKDFLSKLAA